MSKIIALVDGSTYSEIVLDHAAWVANTIEAQIDVVHVIGRRDVGSAPADWSGSLGMGSQQTLLADLAEQDIQRAKLAQQRGRLIVDAGVKRLLAAGVSGAPASCAMAILSKRYRSSNLLPI